MRYINETLPESCVRVVAHPTTTYSTYRQKFVKQLFLEQVTSCYLTNIYVKNASSILFKNTILGIVEKIQKSGSNGVKWEMSTRCLPKP